MVSTSSSSFSSSSASRDVMHTLTGTVHQWGRQLRSTSLSPGEWVGEEEEEEMVTVLVCVYRWPLLSVSNSALQLAVRHASQQGGEDPACFWLIATTSVSQGTH